jgi:competence protein ComEC
MILTHYDRDHIGSAADILDKYEVRSIYIPDYLSAKEYYAPLMKALDGRDGVIKVSGDPMEVTLPDLTLRILPATDPDALRADEKDYDNNMSLVCLMTYGSNRFLFTGDIEHGRIAQIIEDGEDISADWIKIPHHGSYEKKIKKLLKTTNPQYAVISTSTNDPPDERLMSAIDKKGIDVFSTTDGDVVTTSDGKTVVVSGGRTF